MEKNIVYSGKMYCIDSILNKVFQRAPSYSQYIKEYYADYYIKERLDVDKKNFFFRYLPFMFHIKYNERKYIREKSTRVHYTAPDIYDQKTIASVGTVPRHSSLMNAMMDYFHINIYSSTLLYRKLISPLTPGGKKYYRFELDSVGKRGGYLQYKIRFTPRHKSDQLVSGYMIVSDEVWSIRNFCFKGFVDLIHFNNRISFGEVGSAAELLPVRYDIDVKAEFVGNKVSASYITTILYHGLIVDGLHRPLRKRSKYDLSDSYTNRIDTISYSFDWNRFKNIRQIPLDSADISIYKKHDKLKYDESVITSKESKMRIFCGQVGDFLLDKYNINFSNAGSIRCSPLINPFLLSYSKSNGFSYKQSFKYNSLFSGDRLLRITPSIGYNFKQKEFYWKIRSEYNYYPQGGGAFHIDMGNGNLIYGGDALSALNVAPTSLFQYNTMQMFTFRDNYMEVYHSIELLNGLELNVGITQHHRSAIVKKISHFDMSPVYGDLHVAYNTTAPRIHILWTPALYYYMNGKRKVNLQSVYPTFSLDWERGIKHFLRSDSRYERWEFDMEQTLSIGELQSLYYRLGGGVYTNQRDLYFVDFVNFSRNNLPERWSDERSGYFQLLESRWYNSSREYLQGHLSYESPFLIIPRMMKIMRNVVVERLYVNALLTSDLKPYMEFGYGIGTHYFNVEIFSSFNRGKYLDTGCKFTFEIFDN